MRGDQQGSAKEADQRDRNAQMLSLLSGMGAPAGLISALLEMGGHKQSLDDARFLRGPIIYHKSPWAADIPKWMFDQVRAERTEIATGHLRMPVGPTEITVVMFPATMDAPLEYRTTELYLWASVHAVARHTGKPASTYWKSLNHEPIPDKQVLEPGGFLYENYRSLASEIRHKVINAQTARERGEKRKPEEVPEVEQPRVKRPKKVVQQPSTPPLQQRPAAAAPPRPPAPPPRPQPQRKPTPPSPSPGLFSWLWKGIRG